MFVALPVTAPAAATVLGDWRLLSTPAGPLRLSSAKHASMPWKSPVHNYGYMKLDAPLLLLDLVYSLVSRHTIVRHNTPRRSPIFRPLSKESGRPQPGVKGSPSPPSSLVFPHTLPSLSRISSDPGKTSISRLPEPSYAPLTPVSVHWIVQPHSWVSDAYESVFGFSKRNFEAKSSRWSKPIRSLLLMIRMRAH